MRQQAVGGTGRVVVVGAGMGGLAAAVRLAAAGVGVTLVDAASAPGGKMRSLPSQAGPVDAGPTVLTMRAVFDDLFTLAGQRLDDHLTLIPQPILARHWWPDGSTLDLGADRGANMAAIAAFAGGAEAEGFARFDALTARLHAAFEAPVMQAPRPDTMDIVRAALRDPRLWRALAPGATVAGLVARHFRDPRLRQLFGRYATYVGGRPEASPAVLSLIWQAECRGVWAVRGGMHRLAGALATLARGLGVEILPDTQVRRIARQSGRVSGVQLACGRSLVCSDVVFAGDPAALAAGLLGEAARHALPPRATEARSLSAQVWAFAAIPSGPDLVHHNLFFGDDAAAEFEALGQGRVPEDPTLYLCAQDRAAGAPPTGPGPPSQERFEIVLNAPPLPKGAPLPTFDQMQEEDIRCRTLTFRRLARFGLTFDTLPDLGMLTTPARFAQMFPGSRGAIYGRSPEGMLAAFHRPGARTALTGLYLAGGGAHPGAGVPMAALSGRHAAEAILSDRTSASKSALRDTPGGTSTASATTGAAPFRSSGS